MSAGDRFDHNYVAYAKPGVWNKSPPAALITFLEFLRESIFLPSHPPLHCVRGGQYYAVSP
jgi:hypothetical protein